MENFGVEFWKFETRFPDFGIGITPNLTCEPSVSVFVSARRTVHDARSRPVAPRWDHLEHHRDGSYYHGTGVFADLLFDKKSPPPERVTDSGREAAAVV